jgi:hypothetical protein
MLPSPISGTPTRRPSQSTLRPALRDYGGRAAPPLYLGCGAPQPYHFKDTAVLALV